MKFCVYKKCKNNTKAKNQQLIRFYPVPKPTNDIERCARWVKSINRENFTCQSVKKHHFVCSVHFLGGDGPTQNNPDPLPDVCGEILSTHGAILAPDSSYSNTVAPVSPTSALKLSLCNYSRKPICNERNAGIANVEDIQTDIEFTSEVPQCGFSSPNEETFKINGSGTENINDIPLVESQSSEHLDLGDRSENISTLEVFKAPLDRGVGNMVSEKMVDLELSPVRKVHTKEMATSPIICTHRIPPSLETLAQDFLFYQAHNMNSLVWFLQPGNELPGVKRSSLYFKKVFGESFVNLEVSSAMMVSLVPFNKRLPKNSKMHPDLEKPLTSLQDLLCIMMKMDDLTICQGIRGDLFDFCKNRFLISSFICHFTESIRSNSCEVLFKKKKSSLCHRCMLTKHVLHKRIKRMKNLKSGSYNGINIRFLDKEQMKKKVAALNLKNKILKKSVAVLEKKIQQSIHRDGIFLSEEDSTEFEEILKENPFENKSVFKKLLLREQLKLLKGNNSRPRKWHPAIIQWCLYMKAKSPTSYRALKQVITLPSTSTLINYSKHLAATSGFTEEILVEMRTKINLDHLEDHQKYFSLILDEIQIKEDLIFQSSTGEFVGFQNLNEFRNKKCEFSNSTGQSCFTTDGQGFDKPLQIPFCIFPLQKINI